MKKLLALGAVTALLLALAVSALASTDYNSDLFNSLSITSDQYVSSSNRALACALVLVEFQSVSGIDISDDLNFLGDCRIAAYGTCVDIYYPLSGGAYYNLFLVPGSGKITDYGRGTSGPSTSNGYTYHYVSMSDVVTALGELVDSLN